MGGAVDGGHVRRAWILLTFAALCACAPPPSSTARSGQPSAAAEQPRPARTLVMAVANEPDALTSATGLGSNLAGQIRLFNAGVALRDQQGVARPYLAEALPQLNTDTWRVFPDGRMETTYRLRPNLTWQDGAPLTSQDFVFGWRIYATPELGVSGRPPQSHMEEVIAPDDRTMVIRWKRSFPDADTLMPGPTFDFVPLPRHLLAQAFEESAPEAIGNHPYWTRQYVGLGPYRLERWESGAFLEGVAFDGHALGRPKIERIRVAFIRDSNAALASLLSGEVHTTDVTAISFPQGLVLRREWTARNGGTVLFVPNLFNHMQFQMRPEVAKPRAVLDARARRAVAHGTDKQALNDGLFEGEGLLTDTFVVREMPYYARLSRELTKYPYDARAVEQQMVDLGFARGPDGIFASPAERMAVEIWYPDIAEYGQGAPIMVDSLKKTGIDAQVHPYPSNFIRDGQYRAQFTTLDFTGGGISESTAVLRLSSGQIPTPETRWTGQNRGGYLNPEYERMATAYEGMLDAAQRDDHVVRMMKFLSDDVPSVPLYYVLRPVAYVSALQGPSVGSPQATELDNVHEWVFR